MGNSNRFRGRWSDDGALSGYGSQPRRRTSANGDQGWIAFATIMLLNQMLATLSNFEMIVGLCGALFAAILVPLVRNIVRHHFARYRWWGERVIIIGSGIQGQAIYQFYQRGRHRSLKPIGIVDSAETAAGSIPPIQNGSMVYLGPVSRLPLLARQNYVHWGIVAPGGCACHYPYL